MFWKVDKLIGGILVFTKAAETLADLPSPTIFTTLSKCSFFAQFTLATSVGLIC